MPRTRRTPLRTGSLPAVGPARRQPRRPARRPGAAVLVLALLLGPLLAACSASGSQAGSGEEEGNGINRVAEAVERAIERAREGRGGASGAEQPQPTPSVSLQARANTEFDFAAYRRTTEATIGLLQQYWAQALPELGGRYTNPSRYTYYNSDQGGGPTCGEEQAPPRNAFYCPQGDFIAWDESGLLIPYYVQSGDFAASFVLAHEFGHAMQVRLPRQEQIGVLRELQADCFAGAWSAWVAESGRLDPGDLDEATLAVFSARDVPGTPWTDPRAHGSGFERTRAFADGFEDGPDACYPAPGQEWLVQARTGTG